MRELGSAQIHLWQYPIGDPPDSRHLAQAMTLLSPAEKRRCAALHFDKHRTEYLLSHAMLRLALSEYAPVKPEEWEFSSGEWGKPAIAGPSLDMPLWFNLSHTEAFGVCVVGRVPHLGVDVENMNRRVACDDLAKRFFAAPEYEYLRSLPPGLQRECFFRIWTLKEAYIKAQGKGLSIALDSFHFRFSPETPAKVVVDSTAESTPGHWSFFEFRPGLDYRLSIGVRNTGRGGFKVRCLDAAILFFNSL